MSLGNKQLPAFTDVQALTLVDWIVLVGLAIALLVWISFTSLTE